MTATPKELGYRKGKIQEALDEFRGLEIHLTEDSYEIAEISITTINITDFKLEVKFKELNEEDYKTVEGETVLEYTDNKVKMMDDIFEVVNQVIS